jgi:hypothetical protein
LESSSGATGAGINIAGNADSTINSAGLSISSEAETDVSITGNNATDVSISGDVSVKSVDLDASLVAVGGSSVSVTIQGNGEDGDIDFGYDADGALLKAVDLEGWTDVSVTIGGDGEDNFGTDIDLGNVDMVSHTGNTVFDVTGSQNYADMETSSYSDVTGGTVDMVAGQDATFSVDVGEDGEDGSVDFGDVTIDADRSATVSATNFDGVGVTLGDFNVEAGLGLTAGDMIDFDLVNVTGTGEIIVDASSSVMGGLDIDLQDVSDLNRLEAAGTNAVIDMAGEMGGAEGTGAFDLDLSGMTGAFLSDTVSWTINAGTTVAPSAPGAVKSVAVVSGVLKDGKDLVVDVVNGDQGTAILDAIVTAINSAEGTMFLAARDSETITLTGTGDTAEVSFSVEDWDANDVSVGSFAMSLLGDPSLASGVADQTATVVTNWEAAFDGTVTVQIGSGDMIYNASVLAGGEDDQNDLSADWTTEGWVSDNGSARSPVVETQTISGVAAAYYPANQPDGASASLMNRVQFEQNGTSFRIDLISTASDVADTIDGLDTLTQSEEYWSNATGSWVKFADKAAFVEAVGIDDVTFDVETEHSNAAYTIRPDVTVSPVAGSVVSVAVVSGVLPANVDLEVPLVNGDVGADILDDIATAINTVPTSLYSAAVFGNSIFLKAISDDAEARAVSFVVEDRNAGNVSVQDFTSNQLGSAIVTQPDVSIGLIGPADGSSFVAVEDAKMVLESGFAVNVPLSLSKSAGTLATDGTGQAEREIFTFTGDDIGEVIIGGFNADPFDTAFGRATDRLDFSQFDGVSGLDDLVFSVDESDGYFADVIVDFVDDNYGEIRLVGVGEIDNAINMVSGSIMF